MKLSKIKNNFKAAKENMFSYKAPPAIRLSAYFPAEILQARIGENGVIYSK